VHERASIPTPLGAAASLASALACLLSQKHDGSSFVSADVPMFGSTRYDVDKEREDAVTFDEQARAMAELVAAGKIRAWGLSNETPLGVTEFVAAAAREGAPPPASVQNGYNLLQRNDENGLLEAMRHHGVSYLPYSPLSAGVLSGKYNQQPGYLRTRPPAGSRMTLFDGYFDKCTLPPPATRPWLIRTTDSDNVAGMNPWRAPPLGWPHNLATTLSNGYFVDE
jgi:hypothetical protein